MDYLDIILSIDESQFLSGVKFDEKDVEVRHYKKGCNVTDELDGVPSIALIHSGEISVIFKGDDEKNLIVNTLKKGSCFGISNLLFNHKPDTTLECKTDATIIYIPKNVVRAAMEKDAALAMRYGAHCNEKIAFLLKKIDFLTIHSAREKFIRFLLDNKDKENKIILDTTKENLALSIGISRAGLYREIAYLKKINAITQSKTHISLINEDALTNILKTYAK